MGEKSNLRKASGGGVVHRASTYGGQNGRAHSPACSPTGIMIGQGRRAARMISFVTTTADVTCSKCLKSAPAAEETGTSDRIRLAKTDAPEPGQRAWLMKATMKDGRKKTATYDLLRGSLSAGAFVMSALRTLDPTQVDDYSVWVVM